MLNSSQILTKEVGMNTELSNAFQALLKFKASSPKVTIAEEFKGDYELTLERSKRFLHEAGFDSLVTGYVFLKSVEILNMTEELFEAKSENFLKKTKFFSNKLPLQFLRMPFDLEDRSSAVENVTQARALYEVSVDSFDNWNLTELNEILNKEIDSFDSEIKPWEEGKFLLLTKFSEKNSDFHKLIRNNGRNVVLKRLN